MTIKHQKDMLRLLKEKKIKTLITGKHPISLRKATIQARRTALLAMMAYKKNPTITMQKAWSIGELL